VNLDLLSCLNYSVQVQFAVAIAQLVEHRIVVPRVVGSSPISHPIFPAWRSRPGAAAPLAPDRGFTPPGRHFLSFQKLDAVWMHAGNYINVLGCYKNLDTPPHLSRLALSPRGCRPSRP
jgi:hypothetical protein